MYTLIFLFLYSSFKFLLNTAIRLHNFTIFNQWPQKQGLSLDHIRVLTAKHSLKGRRKNQNVKYITKTDNFYKGRVLIHVILAFLQQYFSITSLISKRQTVYNLLKQKSKLQYFVKVTVSVPLKNVFSTEITEGGRQRSGNNSICASQSLLLNQIPIPTSSFNQQFDDEISVGCIFLSSHTRLGSNNTAVLNFNFI